MLLEIKNLKVSYYTNNKLIEVIRGVSLSIDKGECFGLVGESGCGKSTIGLSLTKLLPNKNSIINDGEILFNREDILKFDDENLRKLRGKKISYVFQDPFSSLNPVFTIYDQLKETVSNDRNYDEIINNALNNVGLNALVGKKHVYPHELSGGQKQRVMIAMAIMLNPSLLILDEATTALDVTIQNQILDLVMDLKNKLNLGILFISHDVKTVFRISDKIGVMYAGKIVEIGEKKDLLNKISHPYTKGLMDSLPSPENRSKKFHAIKGKAPLFSRLPQGCKFNPRCEYRIDKCIEEEPNLTPLPEGERPGEGGIHAHLCRCINKL